MFNLLRALIPISDPIGRWRVIIGIATLISLTHIGFANGLVPGFDGYARVSEVSANAGKLQGITIILLEQSISNARSAQCLASANGNTQARQLAEDNLRRYLARYDKETGRQYPLLDCGPA